MKIKLLFIIVFTFYSVQLFSQSPEVRSRFEMLDEILGENSFFDNHLTGFM